MLNYTLLLSALKHDLLQITDVDESVITALIRHFWPEHEDYVKRVTSWQEFLCAGTGNPTCGPLLVRMQVACVWGDGFAIRPDCPPYRIYVCHQVAMLFWKEEVAVDPDWTSYIARVTTSGTPDLEHPIVGRLARWIESILGNAPSWDEILGRCGSGATAESRNHRDRWVFDTIPLGIPERFYQFNEHDQCIRTGYIPWARAGAVPKNRKSARIVASECATAMYAQLGVMREMDIRIHRSLGKRVPIRDADIHRQFLMAHHRDVATLDLSDASDYISFELANYVLPPSWAALCNACRSQYVILPDGSGHALSTYAPMGNGFCFRLLSLVCAGVVAVTCHRRWSDFGDDLICHRSDAPAAVLGLEACGLHLNASKTCYGRYIESCGLELFDGVSITPLKIKRLLCTKKGYADIVAAARAANLHLCELSRILACGVQYVRRRWNRRLQRLEGRIPCWKSDSLKYSCDGWPGLVRWFHLRGENYENVTDEYVRTHAGFRWCSLDGGTLDWRDFVSRLDDLSPVGTLTGPLPVSDLCVPYPLG